MTPAQWKKLLTSWSAQLLTLPLAQELGLADRKLKYLGFPPASASAISRLESRLGVMLPPSYRAFLKATNGFRVISPFIHRLRPTNDIDWFRVENQGWIETWNEPTIYDDPNRREPSDEQYFDYSDPNNADLRNAHLFAMLQISDVGDGVMLLNPLAVTPDREWEAWFFANWIPGAYRYASFAHMMVETYRSLRELEHLPAKPTLPTIKIPDPTLPRHSILDAPAPYKPRRPKVERKKGQTEIEFIADFMAHAAREEITPAPPELVKLVNDLKAPHPRARAKTIRILQGKLKTRGLTTRHPDLVPLAAELAHSLPDPDSRCACISLLTAITPDGPVPKWLIRAMSDPDLSVQQAALYAVFYFKGPELIAPIAKILARATNMQLAQSAATALSEIPDSRAIAKLADLLKRTPSFADGIPSQALEQYYVTIALALAKFGRPAVPHLAKLLLNHDRNRRIGAIVALRTLGPPGSRRAVAKLRSDPDPGVRQHAQLCDQSWGNAPGFEIHPVLD